MISYHQRNWDESWRPIESTIQEQDVWLLTDRIKLRYIAPIIPPHARSLEVGCGSAKLSVLLAEQGTRVTGLDRSPEALRVARNNLEALQVRGALVRGDVLQLPFEDARFDLVLSTGLLEHFANPVPVIAEMVRMLRPGGIFFSDIAPLKFSLLRLGFYARGKQRQTEDEFRYRAQDIRQWLEECGLKQIRVFSSGVVPPLGLVRRVALIRKFAFRAERLWTLFDGTRVGDWLGFFYLAFAIK